MNVTTENTFCEGSLGAALQRQHSDFTITTADKDDGTRSIEAKWTNARKVPCLARVELNGKQTPKQEEWFKSQLYVAVLRMVKQDATPPATPNVRLRPHDPFIGDDPS